MSNQIGDLAQEEESGNKRKRPVKQILLDEAKKFIGIFVYLVIVFGLFVLHEWVVLSNQHISYRFYGFALINALVLAKIILVAEGLHFADRFREKPLAYPIVYKSLAFTILLICAYIAEEIIVAMLHGKTAVQGMPDIGGGTIGGFTSVAIIMCVALIPFFAFREISRVFGEAELHALVFTRGTKAARSLSE
ncbi:MAG: hypothetical protein WA884_13310 [Methyloceanibacter sp.]